MTDNPHLTPLRRFLVTGCCFALSACNMAQSEEQLISAAKAAALKEIAAQYELEPKIEFVDMHVGKGEGDGLLSLVCGQWRNADPVADDTLTLRFLYMGVDKSVIMPIDDETIASVTDPAELKEYKDAQKNFEEIWQESCQ